ncbi:MAG: hypothetical protein ACRCXD_13385 [Luteolibacter sp.]|jgi:hypothetical protein
MKTLISIAKPVSWASLALIVVPPILFFNGSLSQAAMNQFLLAGTVIWFVTASLWMKSE